MPLLSCRDLRLGYENHVILDNLTFHVCAGDYLCVVGENGSGKTTLMRAILGLQRPLGGAVEFGDGLMPNEIGYLPQQTAIQRDFPATVWEIVLSGCQSRLGRRPFYGAAHRSLAEENLRRMGMEEYRKRCYRELSGGQQQRVLLARALCAAKKLLLLDEPVSGLDPHVTGEMYALIDRLHREGMTVIMISHDIMEAMKRATHILHLGRDVFFGPANEYRRSAAGRRFLTLEGGEEA